MVYSKEIKQEAIRLRCVEKLALNAISEHINVPVSTLSGWLRNFPLGKTEAEANRLSALRQAKIKQRLPQSKISQSSKKILSRAEKGLVAETEIKLQLILNGFQIFEPYHQTSKIDLVCLTPKNEFKKIQIKWVKNQGKEVGNGLPFLNLKHYCGATKMSKYSKEECDFFIGYDFFTDSSYVFSFEETKGKDSIAICDAARNAWDKLSK